MQELTTDDELFDEQVLERTAKLLQESQVALPTFAQLAVPALIPSTIRQQLSSIGADDANPLNLFRVHWFNDATRTGLADAPEHLVLPRELTGVDAPIVVALGDRFPIIGAHKVLAAYGCLVPRLVTGRFDPTRAARGVAVDRQLLSRRRRHLPAHGLPRRRGPAGGHEPRALRLAASAGWPTRATSCARRAPRATSRRSTTPARRSPRSPRT